MTAALSNEVVAVAPVRGLTVVPDADTIEVPPKRVTRQVNNQSFAPGGDPLVDGVARLLSIPLHNLYAALWRVGLLEVEG